MTKPTPCPSCGRPTDTPVNAGGIVEYAYRVIYDAGLVILALKGGAELPDYDQRRLERQMGELKSALGMKG